MHLYWHRLLDVSGVNRGSGSGGCFRPLDGGKWSNKGIPYTVGLYLNVIKMHSQSNVKLLPFKTDCRPANSELYDVTAWLPNMKSIAVDIPSCCLLPVTEIILNWEICNSMMPVVSFYCRPISLGGRFGIWKRWETRRRNYPPCVYLALHTPHAPFLTTNIPDDIGAYIKQRAVSQPYEA